MARVTTEDCIDKVSNRFELVMLAALRARELSANQPPTVDPENDKNPVIALREIAEETQNAEDLRERAIARHQTENEIDIPDTGSMAMPIHLPDGDSVVREGSMETPAGLSEADFLRSLGPGD